MTKGINYITGMGTTGYFTAARRLILALTEAGVRLTWTPVARRSPQNGPEIFSGTQTGDPALDPFLKLQLDYDTVILHTLPESMSYWLDRIKNKRIIGYTVWETDTLQSHWVPILNRLDHLLVPCTWNRELFRDQGVQIPISVLPHLPGPAHPKPHPRWKNISDDDLVFYCIETWSSRKNLDQAIALFRQCFTADDKVRLVIKTNRWPEEGRSMWEHPLFRPLRPFKTFLRQFPIRKRIAKLFREVAGERLSQIEEVTPNGAPVDLITDELTWAEIEGLHQRGDCYFSLTHGEGFGLGPFDAAASGKPVITTGWGGVLDYISPEQGMLVDWNPTPAWNREGTGNWAQPSLSHATTLLKTFLADPDSARNKAKMVQANIHSNFGADKLVPILKEVLAYG